MTADTEITCREFVELVGDYLEGRLAEARRVELEVHIGECDGCEAYLRQIRLTIVALRALGQTEDFRRTREQALAAFRELRAGR
jgi:anti-sigma factor RsiW